jgi:hypothetical protein
VLTLVGLLLAWRDAALAVLAARPASFCYTLYFDLRVSFVWQAGTKPLPLRHFYGVSRSRRAESGAASLAIKECPLSRTGHSRTDRQLPARHDETAPISVARLSWPTLRKRTKHLGA